MSRPESFFNIVATIPPATLLKVRLRHSCFPVKFAKFLKSTFFEERFQVAAYDDNNSRYFIYTTF